MIKLLYRYDDIVMMTTVKTLLRQFTVLRETPKGYWVNEGYNQYCPEINEQYKKWVSKTSIKRLCYPTKEEAFKSFLARKKRQLLILKGQIRMVEIACKLKDEKDEISHGEIYDF